ncbi:CoA ester lyase [Micromonospora sp. CP22]|uniref:HpcH/HpaI aldolase/citrate lyase family protein n=1 Tax=Micromonospora sp. CP22 TaxID=2580517 RepID=UPI0012BC3813|nr:CoA ester lyase [Micromonospora sp. CP22]MTK05071.1 CoA ester lyase [Micromonospora sp. CP22]
MSVIDLPRTYLYVPGNAPEKLDKALDRGADALIVDLEDAVPVAEKDPALAAVQDWLRAQPTDLRTELWVRINGGNRRSGDVAALAGIPALRGLALAKVESAQDVREVADQLASLGDHDSVLMPLVESAAAVLQVAAIAAGPRVHQLQIGEVDLAGDTGLEPGQDEAELAGIRMMVVLASAAAGINPPVGPVSRITKDAKAFAESTRRVRRQGFLGRACIHPAQVPVVHEVFTPSREEAEEARTVISRLEAAEAEGSGVLLDDQGRLVDGAVLRNAHKILALAARAEP